MNSSSFQLIGLDHETFDALFDLDDATLAGMGALRVQADSDFGHPCRVSLQDAQAGEELLLLPFEHQPAAGPYRASGPIYVRKAATQRTLAPGEVPPYVSRRQISLRAYDETHMMIEADVVDGTAVAARLTELFASAAVAYVHLHNAKPGCFSCKAVPVRS